MTSFKWNQIIEGIIWYKKTNIQFNQLLSEYLIVAEDHRFLNHSGFDILSLLRAAWKTKIHKKREGGSTIAMQLVRTVTGDYTPSVQRKISEIYFAIKTTSVLTRDEVLNYYLSVAYFGWNMHGIDQAFRKLGIKNSSLTNYEAASLIARLKYPEPRFFSRRQNNLINRRAVYIIDRHEEMESKNYYGTIFSTKRVKKAHHHIS